MRQTTPFRVISRALLAFIAVALFGACRAETRASHGVSSTPPAADPVAPHELEASLAYLTSSAGNDFLANSPGRIEVRNVRFGLRDTTGGRQSYVLCGDFRRRADGDTAQWVPFATVETSKYEQWLGETRFCQTLSGAWNTADSLTTRLQRALE